MRSEWTMHNHPSDQVSGPLIIHGQLYSMRQTWELNKHMGPSVGLQYGHLSP